MFKRILSFLLLSCFSLSAFSELTQSSKPVAINVYLAQNLPYSGLDSQQNPTGLYADFWKAWSLKTDINVKIHAYSQQDIHRLLSDNEPAVYSTLALPDMVPDNVYITPFIEVKTDFYYFQSASELVSLGINEHYNPLVVGGLLPNAEELPLFTGNPNLAYKVFPGLLELLFALYNGQIDSLVVFDIEMKATSLWDNVLTRVLSKTSIHSRNNAMFTIIPLEQDNLVDWIQWGTQFEQLNPELRLALAAQHNPWWGTSATMTRNIFIGCCLFLVLVLISRARRKKDHQFKDVLDSSPYPLAIFSLDGNIIFYLNDEVKHLFPFQKKNKKYIFEEAENQLLLSRYINKASHQSTIENGLIRLLVDNRFHDIEIFAKRTHYKRQTAWLCHFKDVTDLLSAEKKLIEERELLRKVLDSIPEQIAFKSPKGTIIGCNEAWAKANSTTVDHATGRSVADMQDISTIKKHKQQEASVWTGETYNAQEWVQQKKSVDLSLMNSTRLPLYNDKGTIFAILAIDNDITALHNLTKQLKDENLQRKETEKELARQGELLNTIFAASFDPIALLDKDGRIIGTNKSFSTLIGADFDTIVGRLQSEVSSSKGVDWASRQNEAVLATGEAIIFEELLIIGKKKTWYEVHKAPYKDDEGSCQGIVIMAHDITAHKSTNEKPADLARTGDKVLTDSLTNIASRHAFDEYFETLWQQTDDEQEMLSAVVCDIDYFKLYNDNYGQAQGDEVLKTIALALQNTANEMGCFAARYSDNEFVVLIKGGNATKVLRATEKLREAVKSTNIEHLYSENSRYVTVSMGLSSIFPSRLNSMKILMAEAETALYDAKMGGRDQISVHD